ncbi:MAG: helix-turn-helix transcriptional regulator [Pseudonocardiales bacterium]|nr:helix-turn-helix transcriptional regulator [Pseudonocardiales bacterium]
MGPVDLVLGRCAAACDDLDDAAACLESALAVCERIGAPGFVVEAAYELASVRLRRHEADAARLLLTRSRTGAERLGMAPWMRRIDALLGGSGGPLTARERQIADLVALGRSNREIAAQLVLSNRTVGNHVQHILTKLGFAYRSQIAAWVVARGGMSSGMSSSADGPLQPQSRSRHQRVRDGRAGVGSSSEGRADQPPRRCGRRRAGDRRRVELPRRRRPLRRRAPLPRLRTGRGAAPAVGRDHRLRVDRSRCEGVIDIRRSRVAAVLAAVISAS